MLIFTSRCYASAVYAMVWCLPLVYSSMFSSVKDPKSKEAKLIVKQSTSHGKPGTRFFLNTTTLGENYTGVSQSGVPKMAKPAIFDKYLAVFQK